MAGLGARTSSVGLLVVCGALNALLAKIVYQLEAPDCSGTPQLFTKPWLQTALMFVAMALCLPIAWLQHTWQDRSAARCRTSTQQAGDSGGGAAPEADSDGTAASPASPTAHEAAAALAKAAALGALVAGAVRDDTNAAGASASTESVDAVREPLLAAHRAAAGPDSTASTTASSSRWRQALRMSALMCVPTLFDLTATTLMNIGLLNVAASVFQILRGSEMIFAAAFSVTLLRRPLNRLHAAGVALCMAGIACVGVSRLLAGDSSSASADGLAAVLSEGGGGGDSSKALLGMGLILLSQALQAGQVTLEDRLMNDVDVPPLMVVGYEGLIGSIITLAVALPVLQRLSQAGNSLGEDSVASWCMVRNSPAIAGVLAVSTLAVLVYNVAGMLVTDSVGAAARTVLENARTLLVWLAALALYYSHISGAARLGEPWDAWSWLQAVGFGVFAIGALVYDHGHRRMEEEEAAAGKELERSKWTVLKSSLTMHTGHFVGVRRFRAAGLAVVAGVRAGNLISGAGAHDAV